MSSADEDAAGISASLGDERAALQRAQDKIATMQARAGAVDELPQSGVLEDVGSDTDDIQRELDEVGSPPKWTRSSPGLRPRSARAHCRMACVDWRPGRVYFLTLLERRKSGPSAPSPPGPVLYFVRMGCGS